MPAANDRTEVIFEINTLALQDKAKRASGKTNGVEVKADPWFCWFQFKFERDDFSFDKKDIKIKGALDFESRVRVMDYEQELLG